MSGTHPNRCEAFFVHVVRALFRRAWPAWLVLLLACALPNACAAIAVQDPPQTTLAAGASPLTVSYTVTSGAKVLVVVVTLKGTGAAPNPAITSVTYSGQTMTQAVLSTSAIQTVRAVAIFYLYNPPVGTANIVGTFTNIAASPSSLLESFTLSGVDTTVATPPVGSADGGNAGGTSLVASAPVTVASLGSAAIASNAMNDATAPATDTFTVTGATTGTGTTLWNLANNAAATSTGGGIVNGLNVGTNTIMSTVSANGASTKDPIAVIVFAPQQALWTGATSSDWGVATNWNPAVVPNAVATPVVFGNTGATGAVNLASASETVGSVTFFSPVSTTISAGAGNSLTLSNGASVSITTAGTHTISAPLIINSNLSITAGTSLSISGGIGDGGAGKQLTLTSGSLFLSGTNTYAGATNVNGGTLTAVGSIASPVTVAAAAALNPGSASTPGTLVLGNAGTALTATGAATLNFRLNGAPGAGGTNNDFINITTGTASLATANLINLSGTPSGGTYTLISCPAGGLATPTLHNNTTGTLATLANTGTAITVTFASTTVWNGGAFPNTNWATGTNWIGGVAPTSGTSTALAFQAIGGGNDPYTANNNIASPFIVNVLTFNSAIGGNTLTGNPIQFDGTAPAIPQANSGSFTIANNVILNANTTIQGSSSSAGGSGGVTFSGPISGSFGLISNDPGAPVLTLSNPTGNTYQGNTTISTGTLQVSNTSGSATGTGNVSLAAGTTLAGTGLISQSITLNGASTLAPGSVGAGNIGLLTTGSLSLNSSTIMNFDLGANTTPGVTYDQVAVNGNLTLGGTLNINNTGSLQAGIYPLMTYTGTLTGNVSSVTIAGPGAFSYLLQSASGTPNKINLVVSSLPIKVQDAALATPAVGTTSISTPFTVTPGASVLVVCLTLKSTGTVNPTITTPVMFGTSTLTVAINFPSAAGTVRASVICYLFNPPSGTANITGAFGNTSNCDVEAFTLSGVNTAVPPITASGDQQDPTQNVSATVTVATPGSIAVGTHGLNANATTIVDTFTSTTGTGTTLWQFTDTVAATFTGGGIISNMSPGANTITAAITPTNDNISTLPAKDPLAIAVFAPPLPTWLGSTGNDWGVAANWSPAAVPNGSGAFTLFGTPNSNPAVNLVAASETVGSIQFQSATATTISATGANGLTLDNGATPVPIVSAGSQTINAPITLNSNLAIVAGTSLSIGGAIGDNGAGKQLTLTSGSLFLSGANTYAGATNVNGGILTEVGTTASPIMVGAAGALNPGSATMPGTLTLGNLNTALSVTGAGALNFRLSGTPGAGGGTGNDFINVTAGTVSLTSATLINLSGTPTGGTYTLISCPSGITGLPALNSNTTGLVGSLSNTGTAITITFETTTVWNGGAFPDTGWANGSNWVGGVAPASGIGTALAFPAIGGGHDPYTANNNVVSPPFVLNVLTLTSAVGGNTISGAALQFDGASPSILQANSGSFTVTNNIILNANTTILGSSPSAGGSGTLTLSGSISGNFGLISNDPGAPLVTLSNPAGNTYQGNTTIDTGTLQVSNTSGSATGTGSVTLMAGATLAGTGMITQPVALNGASMLAPGAVGTGNVGTLTTGSLTLNASAILNFDVGASTTPGTSYDQVVVNGDLNLAGTLNVNNTGALAAGTYALFTYTGNLFGSPSALTLVAPTGFGYQIQSVVGTPSQINLVVSSGPTMSTWGGSAGIGVTTWTIPANWDTLPASNAGTTLTFPNLAASYTANNSLAGTFLLNSLTITSTGANSVTGNALQFSGTAPTINQDAASGTFTIANPIALNANTAFQGTGTGTVSLGGAISGTGALNILGPGTLILTSNASSFSGATTITGGSLILQNATAPFGITSGVNGALGSATSAINIANATLQVNPAGAVTNLDRSIVFGNSAQLFVSQASNITPAGAWTINAVDATPAILRYPSASGGDFGGGFTLPAIASTAANTLRMELNNGVSGATGVGGEFDIGAATAAAIPCKLIVSGVSGGNIAGNNTSTNVAKWPMGAGPYVQGSGVPGFFFENAAQVCPINGGRVLNSDITIGSSPIASGRVAFMGRSTGTTLDAGTHDLILSPGKTFTITSNSSVNFDLDFRTTNPQSGGVIQCETTVLQDNSSLTFLCSNTRAPAVPTDSYRMHVIAGPIVGSGPNSVLNLNLDTHDGGYIAINSLSVPAGTGQSEVITTAVPHNFKVGDRITVTHLETEAGAGGTPAPTALSAAAGEIVAGSFTVTGVTSNTITVTNPTAITTAVSQDFTANTIKPVVCLVGVGFASSAFPFGTGNRASSLVVNGGLTIQAAASATNSVYGSALRIQNLLTAERLSGLTGTGGFLQPKPVDAPVTLATGWPSAPNVTLRVSHNTPGNTTDIVLGGAFNNNIVVGLGSTETGATLDGGGQQFGGASLRGFGTLTGTLLVQSGSSVWPGATTTPANLQGSEPMSLTGTLDLSAGGKLKVIISQDPNNPINYVQGLSASANGVLTLGSASVLSLGIATGTYTIDIPIVAGVSGSSLVTTKFGSVLGLPNNWNIVYEFQGQPLTGDPSINNPADTIIVRPAGFVTPVTVDAFRAKRAGAGVQLEWHCASEFQNAGFNLYRREWNSAEWARVNSTLIAGRMTNPDAKTYSLYDWAAPGVYDYRLESISLAGVKETYRDCAGPVTVDPLDSDAVAGNDAASVDVAIAGVALDASIRRGEDLSAKFEALQSDAGARQASVLRAAMSNDQAASTANETNRLATGSAQVSAARSTAIAARAVAPATNPVASARWFSAGSPGQSSSTTAARVRYQQAGVLLIPQSQMPAGFDCAHVAIQREGVALTALARTSAGLVVYGQGYQDDYTNQDALFLRSTSAPTAAGTVAQATGLFDSTAPVNTNSPASVMASYYDVYFDYNTAFRPYTFPPWFSSQYLTDGTDQTFSVNVPNATSAPGTLTVYLWSLDLNLTQTGGSGTPDHGLQVLINGDPVGQAQWSGGGTMMQLTFQIPSGVLTSGANQIDLVTPEISGVSSQISLLNSMTVAYSQALDGSAPVTVTNAGSTTQLVEVGNLPSASAWVVDTRFPDRATLVPYEAQVQANGTYTLRFSAASGGSGEYLVVPAGQENLPVSVAKCIVKPIAQAAYLAVGPNQFSAGVQSLLLKHSKEGLRSEFVDQEQLFNYYNYGRYGPVGIQNAVRSTLPKYLLLLGRTTYDYLNYSGANVDPLCPAFLVSTTFWAQTTSDSMFGDLGQGYPQVAVGRLPINNTTELAGAVQNVLSNSGAPVSGVRVHAVADQADPAAGDFPAQAAGIAQALPDFSWQANYLGVTYQTSPEVTAAMTAAANGGADWLIYVGHGNAVGLGNESPHILDTNSVQNWTGHSVFLQSTCTANWMAKDVQDYKSIAIQALTQPQGGIAASIGTSTYMNSNYDVAFMTQLMTTANASGIRWGDALMKTQQWAAQQRQSYYDDLNHTEQIFGDPAMPVFQKSAAAGTTNSGSTPPATGIPPTTTQTVAPGQF